MSTGEIARTVGAVVSFASAYTALGADDVRAASGIPRAWVGLLLFALALAWAAFLALVWAEPRQGPPLFAGGTLTGYFAVQLLWTFAEESLSRRLLTWGRWSLCRHPGWLAMAGLLVGLNVGLDAPVLLWATGPWLAIYMGYLLHLERRVMPRLYGEEWEAYRRSTPFVIPTCRSLRRGPGKGVHM